MCKRKIYNELRCFSMKGLNTIFAFTLLVMAGCGERGKPAGDFITVDVTKSYPKKELILQDFMDVEYILLQSPGVSLYQDKIHDIGEDILLVQNKNDLLFFDRTGLIFRKISLRDADFEDYNNIVGITLDEDNDEMFVNYIKIKKIKVYDLFGNYKRTLHNYIGISYINIYNFNKDNLICEVDFFRFDGDTVVTPSFIVISKKDGSCIKDIHFPHKQSNTISMSSKTPKGVPVGAEVDLFPITRYHDSWILGQISSDTVYRLLSDYSMVPFIARTPSVQAMNPEVYFVTTIFTDRYFFMETIKKEYSFETWQGFPTISLVYDRQNKTIYECSLSNSDRSGISMAGLSFIDTLNADISFWSLLKPYELIDDFKKGNLKGKLKEIAALLTEDSNPVIMIVKHKKI